ncbi:MAG: hypothetical protein KAT68_00585 [Bacteroidales bacterium]|nr:hypothetical protein [Bacteroidales bacterium]
MDKKSYLKEIKLLEKEFEDEVKCFMELLNRVNSSESIGADVEFSFSIKKDAVSKTFRYKIHGYGENYFVKFDKDDYFTFDSTRDYERCIEFLEEIRIGIQKFKQCFLLDEGKILL